jgi:hypothetical protein
LSQPREQTRVRVNLTDEGRGEAAERRTKAHFRRVNLVGEFGLAEVSQVGRVSEPDEGVNGQGKGRDQMENRRGQGESIAASHERFQRRAGDGRRRRNVLPRRGFGVRSAVAGRFPGSSVSTPEVAVNEACGLGHHKHHQGQRRE